MTWLDTCTEHERAFWMRYAATQPEGSIPPDALIESSMAGDERVADELLGLYLEGKKSAGSSLVRDYEMCGDPLPKEGNYWVILNARREPQCIVRTERVGMWRFCDVPEEVAYAEGEGDRSLDHWRKGHRWFFEPYLEKLGIDDLDNAMIITEFFEVVYPLTL